MKHLGDILVEAEIISRKTLEKALARQKESRNRLGVVLEEMGVLTEEELAEALATQFKFKTIKNFIDQNFPPELLEQLPSDFVMKRLVFPLKQKDNMMAVAITDPFDMETMELLTRITGCQILPVITTRKEILAAISRHYLKCEFGFADSESILVVEDSSAVAGVIQAALNKEGYRVFVAADGMEGLKLAISEQPQLIITDSVMPRMDGYGMMRALKANPVTSQIPVIMLSSKATSEDEQKALEFGFIDFISKPVQSMRVLTRVKRALELSRKLKR